MLCGREEGVSKKSTLCTLTYKPKIVNDPLMKLLKTAKWLLTSRYTFTCYISEDSDHSNKSFYL